MITVGRTPQKTKRLLVFLISSLYFLKDILLCFVLFCCLIKAILCFEYCASSQAPLVAGLVMPVQRRASFTTCRNTRDILIHLLSSHVFDRLRCSAVKFEYHGMVLSIAMAWTHH